MKRAGDRPWKTLKKIVRGSGKVKTDPMPKYDLNKNQPSSD